MSVTTRWMEIDAGDGERYDGYLALPRAGKGPGVIIVQEIFGVNAHIRSVAEQYALAGYVALAPDVFWRSERRVELSYENADRDKALALLKATEDRRRRVLLRRSVGLLDGGAGQRRCGRCLLRRRDTGQTERSGERARAHDVSLRGA